MTTSPPNPDSSAKFAAALVFKTLMGNLLCKQTVSFWKGF
jgi:hypothetical protein